MIRPIRKDVKVLLFVLAAIACGKTGYARNLIADPNAKRDSPSYYRNLVSSLKPGDVLILPAGTYRERLSLTDIQGTPEKWITVTGPESGAAAVITSDSQCCNSVQLGNTWYVALRNLTINSNSERVGESIDGIKAKGGPTHDILIENCVLTGLSFDQMTVGISTKSSAWNWTIRGNKILRAGTGIYLGNSDGTQPFIAGIIESNLIVDTIGYNMEIKFQRPYSVPAITGPNKTIIRNNVFIKRIAQKDWPPIKDGSSRVRGGRPNVLVGGFPDSGPGSGDLYEIYGNFFYGNPDESLLQASGRVSIHDNVFAGASDTSIVLQDHDLPLKLAHVFNNTIHGGKAGIWCGNVPQQGGAAIGNLVFAETAIGGSLSIIKDNLIDTIGNAAKYVRNPFADLGVVDFYPLIGQCRGPALDLSIFSTNTDYDLDFNGRPKSTPVFRGAYAGEGDNPGWRLDEGLKVGGPSAAASVR